MALALILFVICLNLYFLFFILLSILYNMGHCGKHSKISFPPLKPESLMTVRVFLFVYLFGFFLNLLLKWTTKKINRKYMNAAVLIKASCRSMWLKMCLFDSLEQKNVFRVFFFAIFSEQMHLPCRTALLLCCSAGLLKQTDETLWKRSALFALKTLNISDSAETPILPWTNSWRYWA